MDCLYLLCVGDVHTLEKKVQSRLQKEDLDRMFALLSRYNAVQRFWY